MLYVYIINIIIYSDTRLVLGSIPVQFSYLGYRNIRIILIFEGFSLFPVILVRFFGSSFFRTCLD